MLGIICAMSIEIDGLKKFMTDVKTIQKAHLTYVKGKLCEKDIVAVECGIGKVNAAMCAQIMIDLFSPKVIINSGIAGALSEQTQIGDIVISEDIVQHDMNTTELGDLRGTLFFTDESRISIPAHRPTVDSLFIACQKMKNTKVFKGRIASGDIFISDRVKRAKVFKSFNALACEMEGAAIGQVCYRNNTPFAILRCISDDVDENKSVDYENFKQLAAQKSINAIMNFLTA